MVLLLFEMSSRNLQLLVFSHTFVGVAKMLPIIAVSVLINFLVSLASSLIEYNLQFAGEIKIGLITFSMLLTVKYEDLKPHIPELAQSIAKELDLNASQVNQYKFLIS